MNEPEPLALTAMGEKPQVMIRHATDVAGVCKEIVLKTALEIQGRKFVRVEGWQSIATAHGCIASSRDVERITGGYKAIGEVRRMSDGAILAVAEGFVGEDEPTWFGGEADVWDKVQKRKVRKTLPKRSDYAIRAMCQTRAISRACRSAFAHVVVMMDSGLSTTPAEEVPEGFEPESGSGATITVETPKDTPQAPKSNPGAITGQSAYDNIPKDELWFLQVIVPVPHRGQRRDEYLRNPDTIGSLYDLRHEPGDVGQTARERLWGFVNNYQPKGWVKRNGEQMPPSEGDIQFRKALDAFADYLEKQPGEEQL